MNLGEQMSVSEVLNRVAFVRWDRCVEDGSDFTAYGWIARDDDHEDFVLVSFDLAQQDHGEYPYSWFTSSAELSERIGKMLVGLPEDGALEDGVHVDCKRIEHVLPGVENSVKL